MRNNTPVAAFPAQPRRRKVRRPSGVALLLCLFVLSIISVWTVNIYQSATVYQSALRNTIEYEQALYLANAGIHHAVAELEKQPPEPRPFTVSGSGYSADAADAAGTVVIVSEGTVGSTTRRLQATVLMN